MGKTLQYLSKNSKIQKPAEYPYHKYVFDKKNHKFIGAFEEMYRNEDKENFDSWFQNDVTHLSKQVSFIIIQRYNFNSILDIGCGTGAFTQFLKKKNNRVVGVDISESAIKKAKSKYRDIEFFPLSAEDALDSKDRWDLIVIKEALSYLKNWPKLILKASGKTHYLFISLYLPPNPIGFVKDFTELKKIFSKNFEIIDELIWNNETIFLLGKSMK